jgi:hypothetical protein
MEIELPPIVMPVEEVDILIPLTATVTIHRHATEKIALIVLD